MRICHVMPALFPVTRYGGAERAAYYLAKGLAELGHENVFLCKEGSEIPFAKVFAYNETLPLEAQLPKGVDIVQLYSTPSHEPNFPYLICIQGNGKPGERFLPNTIFLCADHARRHHWTEYVYNGIDPMEYPLGSQKKQELVFLAKGSWGIKNLKGALQISREASLHLNVCGAERRGWDSLMNPHAKFYGMIGGKEKLEILSRSRALLFPVFWDEPFGVALIEAMACGAAVVGSNWGSLPEIVDEASGFLCENLEEYLGAMKKLDTIIPEACRARVERHFSHRVQAEAYIEKYSKIISQGRLREGAAYCDEGFLQERVQIIPGISMSWQMKFKKFKQSLAKNSSQAFG